MEYIHPTMVVCPKCGQRHNPSQARKREWEWNRFLKCTGCGIVLFAGWDDDKNQYYCEILEGENPYDESILEWQAEYDRLQAEKKRQSRLETEKRLERMRQRKLGIKPFQMIKGGVEDSDDSADQKFDR